MEFTKTVGMDQNQEDELQANAKHELEYFYFVNDLFQSSQYLHDSLIFWMLMESPDLFLRFFMTLLLNQVYNFLKFLKTNFVRFCLSINKNNSQLECGEMSLIPWLDFTQEWTDEKLYKHFDKMKCGYYRKTDNYVINFFRGMLKEMGYKAIHIEKDKTVTIDGENYRKKIIYYHIE